MVVESCTLSPFGEIAVGVAVTALRTGATVSMVMFRLGDDR